MFAFALVALQSHPDLLDVIDRRFPMVFVDEMKDTSWEQGDVLNHLFDGKAVMQRFGDVDQKIFLDDDDTKLLTFPRAGNGSISTSKRFGPRIAAAVASVRISRQPITGEAPDDVKPVLLLYKTEDAGRVLRHFGKLVMDRFDADALLDRSVRAMCTRKTVEGAVDAGRYLVDYWPAYAQQMKSGTATTAGAFWTLIDHSGCHPTDETLAERAVDVRKVLLYVLREAGAPVETNLRDARSPLRAVAELQGSAMVVQALIRDLVVNTALPGSPGTQQALPRILYQRLQPHCCRPA